MPSNVPSRAGTLGRNDVALLTAYVDHVKFDAVSTT
jgi:hypothetical protein